jgi:A/G-specific adenine glycosylase
MDLGATICTPKSPACVLCPWTESCLARQRGIAADLPRKRAKVKPPTRHGVAFWLVRRDGAVLLRRRPPRGLLGGMMEIPSTPWRADVWSEADAAPASPTAARKVAWQMLPGQVSHTFTHFHLQLQVMTANLSPRAAAALDDGDVTWVPVDDLGRAGLPSVMAKIVRHALAHMARG